MRPTFLHFFFFFIWTYLKKYRDYGNSSERKFYFLKIPSIYWMSHVSLSLYMFRLSKKNFFSVNILVIKKNPFFLGNYSICSFSSINIKQVIKLRPVLNSLKILKSYDEYFTVHTYEKSIISFIKGIVQGNRLLRAKWSVWKPYDQLHYMA